MHFCFLGETSYVLGFVDKDVAEKTNLDLSSWWQEWGSHPATTSPSSWPVSLWAIPHSRSEAASS